MVTNLTQDLHHAARNLWRNRGFAASAIVILAVGIAASTGLFAVLDAVVLHPLPYANADRFARVRLMPPSGRPRPATVNAAELRSIQRASTLDGAFLHESFTKTLAGSSFPESVWTEYYTGNAPSGLHGSRRAARSRSTACGDADVRVLAAPVRGRAECRRTNVAA